MEKIKSFKNVRFSADTLNNAISKLKIIEANNGDNVRFYGAYISHGDSVWGYDDTLEYMSDYRDCNNNASFQIRKGETKIVFRVDVDFKYYTRIEVESDNRDKIYQIFEIFEKAAPKSQVEISEVNDSGQLEIFVGHGRSPEWMQLKNHLQDQHGYGVVAYETGARAGHGIRDILEDMVSESSFALLVMTAEDEQPDGSFRCRQNVVHEAGLFQGRLGFARAIILLEEGVEKFSNLDGIQYIPFATGNIKESYGEVLATLRREFGV